MAAKERVHTGLRWPICCRKKSRTAPEGLSLRVCPHAEPTLVDGGGWRRTQDAGEHGCRIWDLSAGEILGATT